MKLWTFECKNCREDVGCEADHPDDLIAFCPECGGFLEPHDPSTLQRWIKKFKEEAEEESEGDDEF